MRVAVAAAVPDEIETIAARVNRERERADHLIVTGGLGGTPDDLTREAIAAAFGVEQVEVPELADELRRRYRAQPGLRGAVGSASSGQPAAAEPARRRAGLR